MNQPIKYYGARTGWNLLSIKELWQFRELIWTFGIRDIKVRYRPAMVGILWAIIQPLFSVLVFGLLIRFMDGKATGGETPYFVTAFCALVPWQFFATSISLQTASIANNAQLIKKVYFPRLVLPVSSTFPAMLDFAVASILQLLIIAAYGVQPSWTLLLLPVLLVVTALTSFAIGVWLSALNAIYRDIQFAIPFALQLGMFISPVFYEADAVVPDQWRDLYYLNPVAGLLQGYRAVYLGHELPPALPVLLSAMLVLALAVSGAVYFRRTERLFADVS